jgi:hypothetical protein
MLKMIENGHSGFIQVSIQVIGLNHNQMMLIQIFFNIGFNIPSDFELKLYYIDKSIANMFGRTETCILRSRYCT